jgi:hypothetical protein
MGRFLLVRDVLSLEAGLEAPEADTVVDGFNADRLASGNHGRVHGERYADLIK